MEYSCIISRQLSNQGTPDSARKIATDKQGKDRLGEVAVKFAGFSRSLGFIKSRGLEETQLANSNPKNRD